MLFFLCVFTACREEIDIPVNQLKPEGIYIINEGSFGSSTGDISFLDPDSLTITNNLFFAANGTSAGDVVQDMLIHDTLGIIVVNNSNKIRIVNINTFKLIKDISVTLPRRIVRATSTKAYISCWNGVVQILDLNQLVLTGTIAMDESYPEGMTVVDNRAFICLSSGFDFGVMENQHQMVSVVNVITDSVIDTIQVGYNPLKMAYDEESHRLYVACGGSEYTTPKAYGGIYIISVSQLRTIDVIRTQPGDAAPDTLYPSSIWIDDQHCYFVNHFAGNITIFNKNSWVRTGTILGNNYNVAVDPYTNLILATTMSSDGKIKIYNQALELIEERSAGEYPSTIVFRYSQK